jgi:hypothetical protein
MDGRCVESHYACATLAILHHHGKWPPDHQTATCESQSSHRLQFGPLVIDENLQN